MEPQSLPKGRITRLVYESRPRTHARVGRPAKQAVLTGASLANDLPFVDSRVSDGQMSLNEKSERLQMRRGRPA